MCRRQAGYLNYLGFPTFMQTGNLVPRVLSYPGRREPWERGWQTGAKPRIFSRRDKKKNHKGASSTCSTLSLTLQGKPNNFQQLT